MICQPVSKSTGLSATATPKEVSPEDSTKTSGAKGKQSTSKQGKASTTSSKPHGIRNNSRPPTDLKAANAVDNQPEEREKPTNREEARVHATARTGAEDPAQFTAQECLDTPGYVMKAVDHKLKEVYGDYLHQNDGTHLHGGVKDDKMWQDYFNRLIVSTPQYYKTPNNAVGKRFVQGLAALINDMVLSRTCNSEKILVYIVTTHIKMTGTHSAADIRKRFSQRLDAWDAGKFEMLVQDTELAMKTTLIANRGSMTEAQIMKTFMRKCEDNGHRAALNWLLKVSEAKGGTVDPTETDDKTGDTVAETLQNLHPTQKTTDASKLHPYPNTPEFRDVHVSVETVEKIARQISGAGGPVGIDSNTLSSWLLRFGDPSTKLRAAFANLANFLANGLAPWAAYRGLKTCRMIALDKGPGKGVRPVGIGDTIIRTVTKCIISLTRTEVQEACGTDQLCGGTEAGIEGLVHAVTTEWELASDQEEREGFILDDARNAFNVLDRNHMLWNVRHELPSLARFIFNCYKHWSRLVLRVPNGKAAIIISSQTGTTQGGPESMIAYGVGILPMIRQLKTEFPNILQVWYADDGGAKGTLQEIHAQTRRLMEIGPEFGYYLEPTKSILLVQPADVQRAAEIFSDLKVEIQTGARYLGGYLGTKEKKLEWVRERVEEWTTGVKALAKVCSKEPQHAYCALVKYMQHEWQYIQRVIPGIENEFGPLQEAIRNHFIPALTGRPDLPADSPVSLLAHLPVRCSGLGIMDPTKTATKNYKASTVICTHLIAAIRGKHEFRIADHSISVRESKTELRNQHMDACKKEFETLTADMPHAVKRTMERGQISGTGAVYNIIPKADNGTRLSPDEFRDSLCIRYALEPANVPSHCDGCGHKADLDHLLNCKKGGLVIQRHDEIKHTIADLSRIAYGDRNVRDEPFINHGHVVSNNRKEEFEKENNGTLVINNTGDRADVSVRGVFQVGTQCSLDVRITNLDTKSQRNRDPMKALASHEKQKKTKYLQALLDQRRHFVPFVISCDGIFGKEASSFLQTLSGKLAGKWKRPYSVVRTYVNSRISIATARTNTLCIRGSRTPYNMEMRRAEWADASSLGLYKYI